MLSKIEIQGFKCFDKVSLSLRNMTLLTGINSAGKSSAIQALLLLMQQENGKNPLNGKYIKLGLMADIKNWMTNPKYIWVAAEGKNGWYGVNLDSEGETELYGQVESLPEDFVYLSAERVGVEDVYKQNLTGEDRIGAQGEYAFDYLSRERFNKICEPEFIYPGTGVNLGNQVDYWLNYIMGYYVTADRINGTEIVKVSYRRGESGSKEIKPQHVGTGLSYTANVIISALSCKKGSLFIVENPEIHLHPGAQAKLLEFFCFLAERGLQVVMETHSDHFFNGVRKNVKKNMIAEENVQIYFFKQMKNQLSDPVEIRIDRYGLIKNPEKGLFDQFDDDLDELLGL